MNFDMSNQNQNQNVNGLLRYRSAPSSVLQSFVDEIDNNREVNDGLSDLNFNVIPQSFQDVREEVDRKPNLTSGCSMNSQFAYQYPKQSTSMATGVGNSGQQSKKESSLYRQNSSPAGLFSGLNPSIGYSGPGGTVASYRLARQISSSSGANSVGILPRISETEPDTSDPGVLSESSDYAFGSWEHERSSHFIDNFTGLKRDLDRPNGDDTGSRPLMLSHHLSLPKTSGEMASVEKLLHYQDSVPYKIRAKRGYATHPRSIAERVRRTRISERMRKLQDLVPHMDKQTNTSDMLDLAVDYIKDLQEQYKALKDCRANCRCSAK